MSDEFSIELSLDQATKLLSCRMNNNGTKVLILRRPIPPLDMRISGPPGTAPHYMVLGLFSVPKITIEPGQHYITTFQLPGNFAFTVAGDYLLRFSYRSLRSGGIGKTEGVDDVSAESNSVVFVVKPEDLPPRLPTRSAVKSNRDPTSVIAVEKPAYRRAPKTRAGRTRHTDS